MKKSLVLILSLASFSCISAQISITGTRYKDFSPDTNTGLKTIFVVENGKDAVISYTASSSVVKWQMYSKLGGGYAEEVDNVIRDGNTYSLPASSQDLGYIINDGQKQICFWVADYSFYHYNISGISTAESDCDRIWLNLTGSAPEIPYYTINGHRELIDRKITVEYSTLRFDEGSFSYEPITKTVLLSSANGKISVESPLCDTHFTISPGIFADWDDAQPVHSQSFASKSVQAQTKAEQEDRDADNEQKTETSNLGGSAPCDINFSAAVSDAAIYHRWEIASDPDFNDVQFTIDQLDFSYTFTEAGNTYVRLVANNAEGDCEYLSDTYTISIGESKLDCPNAFSPGNADGVNDEWKVSYSSIVEFHCEIFNRWGKCLAKLTDPSQGWDGKVNGKVVGSGVYFYVINARGADGKVYKLSGDINVINSRRSTNQTVDPEM